MDSIKKLKMKKIKGNFKFKMQKQILQIGGKSERTVSE
jgi:hypothetical protein